MKNKEVDAWFKAYENPMKPVLLKVREILLAADPRLDECIKWKTPTFTFNGNLVSFNPKAKQYASLLFHTGAQIPGKHASLQGGGGTARYMNIADLAEANKKKAELVKIVKAWCTWKGDGSAKATPTKNVVAKKKPAATKKKKVAKKKQRR